MVMICKSHAITCGYQRAKTESAFFINPGLRNNTPNASHTNYKTPRGKTASVWMKEEQSTSRFEFPLKKCVETHTF
jgi:hypothetical protein